MTRKISLAVAEGFLDRVAAEKLLDALNAKEQGCTFIDKRGRNAFWSTIHRYNTASQFRGPILGIADLESIVCPSGLIAEHLPHGRQVDFVLRIAVRMLESWLLADREGIAHFLQVPLATVPSAPDLLDHAKQELVNLARRSRSREMRDDLVPEVGSSGLVGHGYTTRIQQFIRDHWNPLDAQNSSASLRRAIAAIQARCQP